MLLMGKYKWFMKWVMICAGGKCVRGASAVV